MMRAAADRTRLVTAEVVGKSQSISLTYCIVACALVGGFGVFVGVVVVPHYKVGAHAWYAHERRSSPR